MNYSMAFSCLLLLVVKLAFGDTVERSGKDVKIHGISIEFDVDKNTFPSSWQTEEINATGVPLSKKERERSIHIIQKAFDKYPESVLTKNLVKVVVLKEITFYGIGYGGTNSTDVIYITNDGVAEGYTDDYIEQVVHHEFSSILLRNHPEYLDTDKWMKINKKEYGTGGVDAIRNGTSSGDYDEGLMELGFLCQYSCADIEEDFNVFAQYLFRSDQDFWDYCAKYPGLNEKLKLMIAFYSKVDRTFSRKYFQAVSKS